MCMTPLRPVCSRITRWNTKLSWLARTPLSDEDMAPLDEWDAIALNYTSGTTGNPKGVVYHHRGAYLNALGNALEWDTAPSSPVSLDAAAVPLQRLVLSPGRLRLSRERISVCAPRNRGRDIEPQYPSLGVTHMCGAPIVVNMATTEAEASGQ